MTAIGTHSQLRLRIPTVGTHMKCLDPSKARKTLMPTLQLPRHWVFPLHFGSRKASTKAGEILIITLHQMVSSLVPSLCYHPAAHPLCSFLVCGWSLQWPSFGHSSASTEEATIAMCLRTLLSSHIFLLLFATTVVLSVTVVILFIIHFCCTSFVVVFHKR